MPLVASRSAASAFGLGWGKFAGGGADAMTAIASTTLSSTASSITFSSIPADYDDLMLVAYYNNSSPYTNGRMGFNSDFNTNYSYTNLRAYGTSSATVSVNGSNNSVYMATNLAWGVPYASNTFGVLTAHILNYANTSGYKTVFWREAADSNTTFGETALAVGLWRSTSAVSSWKFEVSSGSFSAGSVFALYGIQKAA